MKETLYILNDYYIGKSDDTIQCTKYIDGKEEKIKIPIERLKDIVISGSIKISTILLSLCNKFKIPIYFCNYYGNPIGTFYPKDGFSPVIRIKQYECYATKDKKMHICKSIAKKSLAEHMSVITRFDKNKLCSDELQKIQSYTKKIDASISENELRGNEANFMKEYYKGFSKLLKVLTFGEGRTRQPPLSNANAVLSFGNMLVYSKINTMIYTSGLDPTIGFLHEPQGNRMTLALDISEIFKPYLSDTSILRMDHTKKLTESDFREENGGIYLNDNGREKFTNSFRNIMQSTIPYNALHRRISIEEEFKLECYNLIKYITDETDSYIPLQFDNW